MNWKKALAWGAAGLAVYEIGWWVRRRGVRGSLYAMAQTEATLLQRPLVVVGAPDAMITGGYGCGDVTVDLVASACPHAIQADITKPLPFATDSVVVFVACTLEYVDNLPAAVAELERISGGHLYVVRVEPWTLTAYLFPGAKRVIHLRDLPAVAALGRLGA
jgi:hypothetical protein